jgi:hypothetical protein
MRQARVGGDRLPEQPFCARKIVAPPLADRFAVEARRAVPAQGPEQPDQHVERGRVRPAPTRLPAA